VSRVDTLTIRGRKNPRVSLGTHT